MNFAESELRVVTFGELLLRLDSIDRERLVQAHDFRVSYTGGEANVAVALSSWGIQAAIVSRVPSHDIGQACINHFRRYGVDTTHVVRGGERLGILFVETGAHQRSPLVIYDRQRSAFCSLTSEECDWDAIFHEANWLHFTGTAPAVGGAVRETLFDALRQAKTRGLRVSFDCSYRRALWSVKEAADLLPALLEYVDVFIGSESDARQFLGISQEGEEGLRQLRDQYHLTHVAYTNRTVHPDGTHSYDGLVYDGKQLGRSPVYRLMIVDRIGAGDAFAAGVIRGVMSGHDMQKTTRFATAAAVLAHSIPGDFALVSPEEVERLARAEHAGHGWR